MDSLFYTDEELLEYDNYIIQNDVRDMELFLEDCEDFKQDIIALSTSLNGDNIENLNINLDLYLLINTIKELKEYKDNLNLNGDNRRYVNKTFDELKKELVILKNKHIQVYNSKVEFINDRITELNKKLNKDGLSLNVKNLLSKLSLMNKCDVFIDGKWDQNVYLDTLDYNKLNELYNNVSEIERLLKIKSNEPLDLFSEWNYVDKEVNKIKNKLKKELSLSDINANINKCNMFLERVINLEFKIESMRDDISNDMFGKYNGYVIKLLNKINNIKNNLIDMKNNSSKNDYNKVMNILDDVSEQYDILDRKSFEYESKCTAESIGIFNGLVDKLVKKLDDVHGMINEYRNNGLLNEEQINNITNKLKEIADKHKNIKKRTNYESKIFKNEVEETKHNENKYNMFISLLNELDSDVSRLNDKVRDKDVRRKISLKIKECDGYIDGFNHLLEYYKINESGKYDETKVEVDKLKARYKNICDTYYNKCPLRVKATRSIKTLYKEHPKMGLISGGLSALALLFSAHSLIPAIMHGNALLGSSIPGLKGMMDIFNKILGSVIGAKNTINGGWKLVNGVLLNSSVAVTCLLKSLAGFGVTAVSLVAPMFIPNIISKIKLLVEEIKKCELKKRLKVRYDETKKEVVRFIEKIEDVKSEREINKYYDDLYEEYCDNIDMSLDEFCIKYELDEKEKKILQSMEENDELRYIKKQELKKIHTNEKKVGRNK